MNKKIRLVLGVAGAVLVILASFAGGMLFESNNHLTTESATAASTPVDLSAFWKVWQLVNQNFVVTSASSSEAQLTDENKVFGAIQGMVDSLGDPYSVFLPPEENKMFAEEIRGKFGGVGMEIGMREEAITVIAPLPNTPAKKAGIVAGDKIFEIDGQSTAKMNVNEAVKRIRGKAGTSVSISILRDSKPLNFKLVRDIINVPTIETKDLPGGITQIKLFSFGESASRSFAQAIKAFAAGKNKYLILDLRGNPGGYLESAIDIASWFLPKGTPVVIEERGEGGESRIFPSAGHALFTSKPKMVILVDQGSASASEILAGALRENGVAKLIGERTFGKGSVQELFAITKNTSLKLTTARWLTPRGVSISQNGLAPDYEVKMDPKASTTDAQLDKAIEVVKSLK